jgi:hypothetical protein
VPVLSSIRAFSLSEIKDDSQLWSQLTKEFIDKMIVRIDYLSELFLQKGESYGKTAIAGRFSALDKLVLFLPYIDGYCSAARAELHCHQPT